MNQSLSVLLDRFSLWEAATLWNDVLALSAEEVPDDKRHAVNTVLTALKYAVLDRTLETVSRLKYGDHIDVFRTVVSRNVLKNWAASKNMQPLFLSVESRPEAVNTSDVSRGSTKREQQIQSIEEAIRHFNYPPMEIPARGKTCIKERCRATSLNLFGMGDDPFKEAWQEGVKQKRFRTKNHQRYSSKQ